MTFAHRRYRHGEGYGRVNAVIKKTPEASKDGGGGGGGAAEAEVEVTYSVLFDPPNRDEEDEDDEPFEENGNSQLLPEPNLRFGNPSKNR